MAGQAGTTGTAIRNGALSVAATLLIATAWLQPRTLYGYKLEATEDIHINLKAYVQGWATFQENDSPDGDNWATQFYLRRTRVLLSGQVTEHVKFFYGTLQLDFGKNQDFSVALTSGDAWIELDLDEALKIDVGFLMIPFIRNFRQGGGNLHTIDFHNTIRKYPVNGHRFGRDTGVGLRGLLFDQRLNYYLHLTQGSWAADGAPRVTARAVYNLFDAETNFYLGGSYLGKKRIVSAGLALDMQPGNGGIAANNNLTTYYSVGGDIFVDYPLDDGGIVVQVNVAYFVNSVTRKSPAVTCDFADVANTCKPVNGLGILAEVGYRIGKFEPLLGLDWFFPYAEGDYKSTKWQTIRVLAGFNYWLRGHRANIKLQYAWDKPANKGIKKGVHGFVLQVQALFN